jgi:aminopeptidase
MGFKSLLTKYAKLIVKVGVNVQKNQFVVINSPIAAVDFTRELVKQAYKAGAGDVYVNFSDPIISRHEIDYKSKDALADVPDWIVSRAQHYINKGICLIGVNSPDPYAMEGADAQKMQIASTAAQSKLKELREYTMSNHGQWCVVAYPNLMWAKKVFPDLSKSQAYKKLLEAMLKAVYINADSDPIEYWKNHNKFIHERSDKMNQYNFKTLHFKNSLGTNLKVDLVPNHIWHGGSDVTSKGVVFNPNVPTEEIFTMPSKRGVNGKVYASKPLNLRGALIEGIWVEFKDGAAVNYGAKKNEDVFKALIQTDAGSSRLGEVALVPYSSPINLSGILYYNTLFDENASCHLALGRAYPTTIKNGTSMSKEQLDEAGCNESLEHVDFMIGTNDMDIDGILQDGKTIPIFRNGNFVI